MKATTSNVIPWEDPNKSRKSNMFWHASASIQDLLERSSTLNIGVDVRCRRGPRFYPALAASDILCRSHL